MTLALPPLPAHAACRVYIWYREHEQFAPEDARFMVMCYLARKAPPEALNDEPAAA